MTLLDLLKLLKQHWIIVVVFPIMFGLVTFAYTHLFMADRYSASATVYVLATQQQDGENLAVQTALNASQMISRDVASIITGSSSLRSQVASEVGLPNLSGYSISVDDSTNTRILKIRVNGPNPKYVADIANALADNVSDMAREVMSVDSVNVIDRASQPRNPSGPDRMRYTLIAVLAGLFVGVAIVIIMDLANTRVRDAEDVEKLLGVSVIGKFPKV